MRHPLERIPTRKLRYALLPTLLLTFVTVGSLPFIMPLREVGTGTVVELVEAGNAAEVRRLVAPWSTADRVKAAYAVGMDYLMTLSYMSVVAILMVWASRRTRIRHVQLVAISLVWICSILPLTNVIENIMLRDAFLDTVRDPWPLLASYHHYGSGAVLLACALVLLLGLVSPRRGAR